mgnify:CR=1 FL=1
MRLRELVHELEVEQHLAAEVRARLLGHGVGAVILTRGASGAMLRDQKGTRIDLPAFDGGDLLG